MLEQVNMSLQNRQISRLKEIILGSILMVDALNAFGLLSVFFGHVNFSLCCCLFTNSEI